MTSLDPVPSCFARRVSFDNYKPSTASAPVEPPNGYFFPTSTSTANTSNTSTTNTFNTATPPNSKGHSDNPSTLPTHSILKKPLLANSVNKGVNLITDSDNITDDRKNLNTATPLSNDTLNDNLLSGVRNSFLNSSLTSLNINDNNDPQFTSNASKSSNTFNNNIRKKSYSEMSDSELLALDSQFNIRSIDFQKSYGFNVTSRLSNNPLSNCDKDLLDSNNINTNSFKNLVNISMLKDYPTKPIITKNSICINFKHSNLSNNDINNKFYLILLSNRSSSLSCFNYYIKNILSKGDTIVICCSLSTSILGNEINDSVNNFIDSFVGLILSHLESNNVPININFEFFKSFNYLNEVLNLYQPSLIIIGENIEKTKSTAIFTPNKKLLSVVYVGNDYASGAAFKSSKNNNNNNVNNTSNTNVSTSSHTNSKINHEPTINFKLPFHENTTSTNNNTIPSIKIEKSPNFNPVKKSASVSTDSLNLDYSEKLSKVKTNDTAISSLFENLNETTLQDLNISNPTSNSTSNKSSFSYDNSNNYLPSTTTRRKSMLDVLNNDKPANLSRTSSNISSTDDYGVIDSDDDDTTTTTPLKNNYTLSKKKSNTSGTSTDPYSVHQKEKQELFEKYNRRLSAVNVKASKSKNANTKDIIDNDNKQLQQIVDNANEPSKTKKLFKKLFR